MDVVWHDNPGAQLISLTVEESQRVSDQFSNLRVSKKTVSVSGVEVGVHAGGIPAEQFLLLLPGERAFGSERVAENFLSLLFEPAQHLARQRARKSEGNEVSAAFLFQVRQVVARMEASGEMARRVHVSFSRVGQASCLPVGAASSRVSVFLSTIQNCVQAVRITSRLGSLRYTSTLFPGPGWMTLIFG